MNIALDFDETFTAEPIMWTDFIRSASDFGHNIYIVTARTSEDSHIWIDELFDAGLIEVVFCDGQAKKQETIKRGIDIDIWIDDNPLNILVSREAGFQWDGYDEWSRQDRERQLDLPGLFI